MQHEDEQLPQSVVDGMKLHAAVKCKLTALSLGLDLEFYTSEHSAMEQIQSAGVEVQTSGLLLRDVMLASSCWGYQIQIMEGLSSSTSTATQMSEALKRGPRFVWWWKGCRLRLGQLRQARLLSV